jgi:hypothetical protein
MKTKHTLTWERIFSAAGPVEVPAGAPVEWNEKNKTYYVQPAFFQSNSIMVHDATHYGCRVALNNVDFEGSMQQPHIPEIPKLDELIGKGYKYAVQFEEDGTAFGEPMTFKSVEDISRFMREYPTMKMTWQKELIQIKEAL